MGPLGQLQDQLVAIDSAPLIYYTERHPTYLPILDELFGMVSRREVILATSIITLTEVLAKPLREGNGALVAKYEAILTQSLDVSLIPMNLSVARRAASLRAAQRLKTPDALQIASALEVGATAFLTNDSRLRSVEEISVIVLDDLRSNA